MREFFLKARLLASKNYRGIRAPTSVTQFPDMSCVIKRNGIGMLHSFLLCVASQSACTSISKIFVTLADRDPFGTNANRLPLSMSDFKLT